MNREEFDKLYLGKAVHCDTEEKANEFLALADSVGYKWTNKRELINYSQWETYKKETCYELTKRGFMFGNRNYLNQGDYQFIEYQLQPKFKVGDKVRINSTAFTTINEKVGVIERVDSLSPISYAVKVDSDGWFLNFYENQLEKVEEPTYKDETINDIIEEIKEHQKSINVLLNRLERKVKAGK